MQNSLNNLTIRAEKLAKLGVISDFCIPDKSLLSITEELKVCLPLDFSDINKKISYIGFSVIGFSMVYLERNYIAEKEWGMSGICAVIGGMHLLNQPQGFLDKATNSLKNSGVTDAYPSHCTDLGARIAFAKARLNVHEMGAGKRLSF